MVYYDTGVWVAYFLGKLDPHNQISCNLVELVENGEKRAIVSYLLIMEATHVIRRRIVQRHNPNATNMMEAAMAASGRFTEYVFNGLESGKLILVRSNGIDGHDYRTFRKASSIRGEIREIKEYRALGHADVEHAYLADYGGALEFHTLDRSFDVLSNDPDFGVKFVVHKR